MCDVWRNDVNHYEKERVVLFKKNQTWLIYERDLKPEQNRNTYVGADAEDLPPHNIKMSLFTIRADFLPTVMAGDQMLLFRTYWASA